MTASIPTSSTTPDAVIAPTTTVGPVALVTGDLPRLRAFYETAIGLSAHELSDDEVALGPDDGPTLVRLRHDPAAPQRDPRAPGLFHVAILSPTRRDLAEALLRVAHARWPLTGASDHLVSEALYLRDPEGNGIELYRDRPRADWPRDSAGQVQMATLPLDLDDLLGEVADRASATGELPAGEAPAPAGTCVGHVHLQVSDIPRAHAFYCEVLGFEATVRDFPGALFASAGGYHHHLGFNTWNSAGAVPAGPGTRGLDWFEVAVPSPEDLARVRERLDRAGVSVATAADGNPNVIETRDPFGTGVRVGVA